MNLENEHPSKNVEVGCLGIQVPLYSPEARAALACQQEVASLRQGLVDKISKSPGLAALKPGTGRESVATMVEEIFDFESEFFLTQKGLGANSGETYQSRLREFKDQLIEYLYIPALTRTFKKP